MKLDDIDEAFLNKHAVKTELEKETSQIIDDAIEEAKSKEDIEEFEKMEMEQEQVNNNQIYEQGHQTQKDIQDIARKNLNVDNKTFDYLQDISKKQDLISQDVMSINDKFNKKFIMLIVIMVGLSSFMLGAVAHANIDSITPYSSYIWDIIKTFVSKFFGG